MKNNSIRYMTKNSVRGTLSNYGIPAVITIILVGFIILSGNNADIKDYWPLFLIPAAALLVSYFRDNFGLVCILFAFLPFARGGPEFELGIITFNPYTIGIIGLMVLSFLDGKHYFSFGILDGLILLLCFSYLSSTLLSKDLVASGFIAFHGIFIPTVTYFVLKTWINTKGNYERLIWFFIAGAVLISIAGLVSFLLTRDRETAFNLPPIGMAGLAMVGLILMITSSRRKSLVGKIVVIILFLALIASFSRVYMIALLIAPFLYRWIKAGKGTALFVFVFIMSLAGTLILASIPSAFTPKEYDKTQEGTFERVTNLDYWKYSLLGRGYSYRLGLKRFSEKPVFGWGFIIVGVRPRHSMHIEFLEYGGLIGYLLYSSIFLAYFLRVSKKAAHDPVLARNSLIVVVVILNSILNPFTVGLNPDIFFIIMGLSEAHIQLLKKNKKNYYPSTKRIGEV